MTEGNETLSMLLVLVVENVLYTTYVGEKWKGKLSRGGWGMSTIMRIYAR
jgi:hypothetical protein